MEEAPVQGCIYKSVNTGLSLAPLVATSIVNVAMVVFIFNTKLVLGVTIVNLTILLTIIQLKDSLVFTDF